MTECAAMRRPWATRAERKGKTLLARRLAVNIMMLTICTMRKFQGPYHYHMID